MKQPDETREDAPAGKAGDVDVVILGAGINGAGLFRDLCAQGINCFIVDKADFGSGTSAAPSRLIHGGLKYLETGEFGLVAQSTLERNLLLEERAALCQPAADGHPDLFLGQGHVGGAAHAARLDQRAAQPRRHPYQDRPDDLRFLWLAAPGDAAPPAGRAKQGVARHAGPDRIDRRHRHLLRRQDQPPRAAGGRTDRRRAGGQCRLQRGQLHVADLRLERGADVQAGQWRRVFAAAEAGRQRRRAHGSTMSTPRSARRRK